MMFSIKTLLEQQETWVASWLDTGADPKPVDVDDVSFMQQVQTQHTYNFLLWHQEDLARDPDASDAVIADVKRKIDKLNQQRNDAIEILDEKITAHLNEQNVAMEEQARMNSETPGNVIDRLSINALKIYYMNLQTLRRDADSAHRMKCSQKLQVLKVQREDLGQCLQELMDDLLAGRKFLKVYRQMKMYNDETLNPVLYSKES